MLDIPHGEPAPCEIECVAVQQNVTALRIRNGNTAQALDPLRLREGVVHHRHREHHHPHRGGAAVRVRYGSNHTLLVLVALFFLGGGLIHGFAFALIIGVVIGTYSSIYVASTGTLRLGVQKADPMPVQTEGTEELDAGP